MTRENLGAGEQLSASVIKSKEQDKQESREQGDAGSELHAPSSMPPEGELSLIHFAADGGVISWADITLKPGERLEIRRNQ